MSKPNGWSCSKCTFYHHAPAPRCAMCNELRVTKAQMRDFILGKPIPDDSAVSPSRKKAPQSLAQSTLSGQENSHQINTQNGVKSRAAKRPLHNPYAKKKTTPATSTVPTINDATTTTLGPPINASNNQNPLQSPSENSRVQVPPSNTATLRQSPPPPQQQQQCTLTGAPAPPFANGRSKDKSKAVLKGAPRAAARPAPVFQPGPVPLCAEAARDWIYPNDPAYPKRDYQFHIAQTALFHNTLVSLPTGLGKTLIAAVVVYNYYRWFPTGKVVFMAPTLPLVTQQVEACYKIMGIPEKDTAVMTGKVTADRRPPLWKSKRVFFCTPQTIQNDLESERVDPQQIVCIVLDEAHKATGDYSYCRVVKQLEEAGAKFRILGLSATPGSSIKAIQLVVDALHINKVEARREDDPDVKLYIHDRLTEEIVVRQVSACKDVQYKLTDLIAPLLDKLRKKGAMGSGNASLTAWQLIKARERYEERTRDKSLYQTFLAVQRLVKIRDDLHKSGIGAVRTALARLKTENKKGVLWDLVHSKPFEELSEYVNKSSYDPMSNDQSIEHKVMNNPKLSKLREILNEHFERAKAVGNSSRAIVFSQFRDSVAEIVDLLSSLRPVIRPRHFVGQAKGAKNGDGARLKGMTQTEQHQVIKQFRDDIYNVLVCTCIGEEGLDIGEVDLIVNFDTLKSPIRMIQRVGRTGRKRSGRVVCLIAEGSEQNTLNQSKQSERNLAHALRRPESFVVTPTTPLLPAIPVLNEKNMQISQAIRMSQVEGHGGSAIGSRAKVSESRQSKAWRLSEEEEARRAAVMGASNQVFLPLSDGIPRTLKQQLLHARLNQSSDIDNRLSHRLGRVSRALRTLESQADAQESASVDRKRRRAFNDTERYLGTCFPLVANENGFEKAAWGAGTNGTSKPRAESVSTSSLPSRDSRDPKAEKVRKPAQVARGHERFVGEKDQIETSNGHSSARTIKNPYARTGDTAPIPAENRGQGAVSKHSSFAKSCEPVSVSKGPVNPTNHSASSRGQPLHEPCANRLPIEGPNIQIDDEIQQNLEQYEELRLPTPSSSSDEESDDEKNEGAPPLPTASSRHVVSKPLPEIPEEPLVLPSQDSSSDESDDSDEEPEKPVASFTRQEAGTGVASSGVTQPASKGHREKVGEVSSAPRLFGSLDKMRARKRRVFDNSPEIENRSRDDLSKPSAVAGKCVEEENIHVSKKARKMRRVFEDSPEINATRKRLSMGSKSAFSVSDQLMDTQPSPAGNGGLEVDVDIVCGICSSGESPPEDPIVLCDGSGGGAECDVAVHASCYAISMESLKQEHWRCESCQYKFTGGKVTPRCFICYETSGPLSSFLGNEWIHQTCKKAAEQPELPKEPEPSRSDEEPEPDPGLQKRRRKVARAIRKERYGNFFDEEAAIDSDEDEDGDEADERLAREIEEEEEFHQDFINDSTQLGYTQDELDRVDPDRDDEHRALDTERELKDAYATPMLNRQMLQGRNGRLSDVNSELRGLGQMHFIRSVLEHHRQGGDADQIEQAYHEMQSQPTPADEDVRPSPPPKPKRTNVFIDDSDSD